MTQEKKINQGTVRLVNEDVTLIDVDAFVFYATEDLKLGSGFGNAISMRGGASIQEELDKLGEAEPLSVVVTDAGKLNAKKIIHAVGPKFQELDTESKLAKTTENILKVAAENEFETVAFPAMGSGFYGVPPEMSAKVALEAIKNHMQNDTKLKEVIFCLPDGRDMKPYVARLAQMA